MAKRNGSEDAAREAMDFLLDALARVITEQEGAAQTKRIEEILELAHRLRARYASADEKKLVRLVPSAKSVAKWVAQAKKLPRAVHH